MFERYFYWTKTLSHPFPLPLRTKDLVEGSSLQTHLEAEIRDHHVRVPDEEASWRRGPGAESLGRILNPRSRHVTGARKRSHRSPVCNPAARMRQSDSSRARGRGVVGGWWLRAVAAAPPREGDREREEAARAAGGRDAAPSHTPARERGRGARASGENLGLPRSARRRRRRWRFRERRTG